MLRNVLWYLTSVIVAAQQLLNKVAWCEGVVMVCNGMYLNSSLAYSLVLVALLKLAKVISSDA